MEISSHEITETLNIPVNDESSTGAYTFDLIASPKLTSETTQFPTLEQKRFLRDLRSGKVKHEMSTSPKSDREWSLPRMK